MNDPYKYEVGVKRIVDEDGQYFQASVKEFPDLNVYSETYVEAYELIIDAIETSIILLNEQNKPIPQPFESVEDYSGRITLRMQKTMHRETSINAKEDGASLNQFILNAVSHYSGFIAGRNADENKDWNVFRDGERRSAKFDDAIMTIYKASVLPQIITSTFEESTKARVAPVVTVKTERIEYKEKLSDEDKHFISIPR